MLILKQIEYLEEQIKQMDDHKKKLSSNAWARIREMGEQSFKEAKEAALVETNIKKPSVSEKVTHARHEAMAYWYKELAGCNGY